MMDRVRVTIDVAVHDFYKLLGVPLPWGILGFMAGW